MRPKKKKLSTSVIRLHDAYRTNDHDEISQCGDRAAYLHACLEKDTFAEIVDRNDTKHLIAVPCGLYEHGGASILNYHSDLLKLWKNNAPARSPEPEMIDGLRRVRVASDGHCMFAALARQLPDPAQEMAVLRKMAAEHLKNNPGLIEEGGNVAEYVKKVENAGDKDVLWGGDPELRALSHVLQRRIIVHTPDNAPDQTFAGDLINHFVEQDDPLHLYYVGPEAGSDVLNHFDALIPTPPSQLD